MAQVENGKTFPLLEKEGRTRHQTKYREATLEGADGVVRPATSSGLKIQPN
jgi:hypothetical protein